MFEIKKEHNVPPTSSIGVRIPNELVSELDDIVSETGVNRNQVIVQALKYALSRRKKAKPRK